jgi:glyoxylase-like metal-dependent hydrolase (beta-lactamase superfamily II)
MNTDPDKMTTQSGSFRMKQLDANFFVFKDTCNVYLIHAGDHSVLIDFGSGEVLKLLPGMGVSRVDAILMTHHHRDQGQGLRKAVAANIPIFVPHMEQDLFSQTESFWQGRQILNNYNVRQDRFSLRMSVRITGTLHDYENLNYGALNFSVVPTPGHTPGSLSLMTTLNDERLVFSGDLIHSSGKLWSLSATQWTYNGAEGAPATIASLLDLKERQPDVLLPSHGDPIYNPADAIDQLVKQLWHLLHMRGENPRLFELREKPYEAILPHLLRHRASMANAYVLLSDRGKALMIDFGYDFMTGVPEGTDRAARRPWLYTLPALKKQFGVSHVDVVLPTHYHDDHVAGMNLLRDVEGTQTWVPENFSDILQDPYVYDLPCLWYDPIAVDRVLPLGESIKWEEYTLRVYKLPGHTLYAAAIMVEVDGKRVMAVGDQYQGDDGLQWNYVYQNRYQIGDYQATARLYQQLNPELILPGHWQPFYVKPGYFEKLADQAQEMEDLQRSLLPGEPEMGAEGFIARFKPYQVFTSSGKAFNLAVEVRNPYREAQKTEIRLVTPEGWQVDPSLQHVKIVDSTIVSFKVTPIQAVPVRRMRITADITMGEQCFGEQAEALVTVD